MNFTRCSKRRRAGAVPPRWSCASQVLNDEQVGALALHRPLAMTADDGSSVDTHAVGLPIRFDGTREFACDLSMRPGQDSVRVLRAAGVADHEIASLAEQGVIQI
jgi:crotonobetainyl-CoA:carnitine CoA-transferase CaiB-like acyl-CoA transferase